jgi:hypothetical protein
MALVRDACLKIIKSVAFYNWHGAGCPPRANYQALNEKLFTKKSAIVSKFTLDKRAFVCYIITMRTQTTFEPCNQCGNQALLLEGNGGTCLNCLFPAPVREFEGQFLEGCECENCEKHFNG